MKFNILKIFLQLQIDVEESFYTISITCSPHWFPRHYTNNSVFDNVYTVYAVPIFSWENPEVVHLQQNNSIDNLEELPSLNDTLDGFSILQDITEMENSSITLNDDHQGRNFNIEQSRSSQEMGNQSHFRQLGRSLPSPQSHDPHDYIDMRTRSTDCSGLQSVNTSVHERHMQSTSTSSGPISVSSSNHFGYVAEEDYAHTHHNTQGQYLEYNHAFTHNLNDHLSTRGGTDMVSVTNENSTTDSTCILEVDPRVASNNDSLRNLNLNIRRIPLSSIQSRDTRYEQSHNSNDIAPNSEISSRFDFSDMHLEDERVNRHENTNPNNVPFIQENSQQNYDGFCNDPKRNESNVTAKENNHFQSEIQNFRQQRRAASLVLSPSLQRINPELRYCTPNVHCRHPTRPPDKTNTQRKSPLSVAILCENDLERDEIIKRLISKGYSLEAVERAIKCFINTTGIEHFTAEDLLQILRTE
ncbi:uncharacterized protein LOC134702410 [Mytilus trossulus]|uniref:uncharacterized protein LOC134702410 n=1 Tax=Mytilus trossulus TaxID=6551 RepID=UPI003007169C